MHNALCRASAILFHLALLLHNLQYSETGATDKSVLGDITVFECGTLCTQEAVVVNTNTDATEAMLPAVFILRKGTASEKVDFSTKKY